MKFNTRKLVTLSLLMALTIVFTRIASIRIPFGGVEGVRVGFGSLPILLAGILFGPISGFIVGALGDLIGYFLNPMGAYMPHFTLSAGLSGFIPGSIYYFTFRPKSNIHFSSKLQVSRPSFWLIFISILIGQVTISLLLIPYFLSALFSIPYELTIIPRTITQLISIPIFSWVIWIISNKTNIFDYVKSK
ncbi:conserved hypothetical protein [Alkaliphilus metalliredigens QYMF]|uniref:Signal transduction histidine kinase, LytS n=1 Tax=Alkaliphilus metalliredigens (strain QYMF) TaxID=293826 RepID=A6TMH2_ALKMQ|nr:folate family ECF transporter S component [Alkaliphilus metalliredigens]ABR47390.1 conserved hypothetical protein [Alkaliphilus metalliredigens QYMF]